MPAPASHGVQHIAERPQKRRQREVWSFNAGFGATVWEPSARSVTSSATAEYILQKNVSPVEKPYKNFPGTE